MLKLVIAAGVALILAFLLCRWRSDPFAPLAEALVQVGVLPFLLIFAILFLLALVSS